MVTNMVTVNGYKHGYSQWLQTWLRSMVTNMVTNKLMTQNFEVMSDKFNPLNAELNPIYHLLALLLAYPILHYY
jgi:hypothetical protein